VLGKEMEKRKGSKPRPVNGRKSADPKSTQLTSASILTMANCGRHEPDQQLLGGRWGSGWARTSPGARAPPIRSEIIHRNGTPCTVPPLQDPIVLPPRWKGLEPELVDHGTSLLRGVTSQHVQDPTPLVYAARAGTADGLCGGGSSSSDPQAVALTERSRSDSGRVTAYRQGDARVVSGSNTDALVAKPVPYKDGIVVDTAAMRAADAVMRSKEAVVMEALDTLNRAKANVMALTDVDETQVAERKAAIDAAAAAVHDASGSTDQVVVAETATRGQSEDPTAPLWKTKDGKDGNQLESDLDTALAAQRDALASRDQAFASQREGVEKLKAAMAELELVKPMALAERDVVSRVQALVEARRLLRATDAKVRAEVIKAGRTDPDAAQRAKLLAPEVWDAFTRAEEDEKACELALKSAEARRDAQEAADAASKASREASSATDAQLKKEADIAAFAKARRERLDEEKRKEEWDAKRTGPQWNAADTDSFQAKHQLAQKTPA
jgi:hypothetical protein